MLQGCFKSPSQCMSLIFLMIGRACKTDKNDAAFVRISCETRDN